MRRLLIVLGCLAGIAVNGFLKFPVLSYIVNGNNDFQGFYAEAQLAGSADLYNPKALARAESKVGDHPRYLPMVRLPFYAAMMSPLRAFPYHRAYWIWQSASLAALVVFVYFWPGPRKWMTAMACCWSAPLVECFLAGRDVAIVLMVLAVSLALFFRGRHFAAGCVLSLCLIKYNLFLPLPLLIAGKRLWRLGGGILAGGAVLLGISFAVSGWSWPLQYAAMLRAPNTTPSYAAMPNLHGLLSGLHGIFPEAAATCAVLIAVWLVIRGGENDRAVAAMLAGGLLVSYHAFFGDEAILIPVGLYLLGQARGTPGKLVGIVMLCPLTYIPFRIPNPPIPPSAVLLLPLLVMLVEEIRARRSRKLPAEVHEVCVTAG